MLLGRLVYDLSQVRIRWLWKAHTWFENLMLSNSNNLYFMNCSKQLFWLCRHQPFRDVILTVNASIVNEACRHTRCEIWFGWSYNKAKDRFVNSLSRNKLWSKIEFTTIVWKKGLWHLLEMYQLWKTVLKLWFEYIFWQILADRCGWVVVKRAVIIRKALVRICMGSDFLPFLRKKPP